MKSFLLVLTIGALLSFAACGGGTGVSTGKTTTYTISANVTGLNSGAAVVLQDNGGNNLTVNADGTFSFSSPVTSGSPYSVSVLTQPAGQTCTPSNSSGTATSNVTVSVSCSSTTSPTYTISVSVTGLTSGSFELQDNNGDTLTFSSNTTQTFATKYASGASYGVTLVSQPAGQTCSATNTSGTITANITVAVTCGAVSTGDTISVLPSGLIGTLVVQDNQGDSLTFTTNSTQTFAKSYANSAIYSVTVVTQPTGQTCTLSSNATGTITSNITVTATCTTNTVNDTISVTTTGLTGTLVVQDSKSDKLTFTTNSTQTFATSYASGSTYSVTVLTQPTGQTCTLSSNSTGTITSNITVTATCTTNVVNYTISVAVTGLTSGSLVVQDSKSDTLTFTSNTTQNFATTYASGSTYSVSVETQPAGQTCTLSSNASGTITSNVTVTATCATSGGGPKLSVSVSGLSGTVTLEDDQSNTLTFTSSGTQTFANTYTAGSTYTVYVTGQPSAQACTPTYSTATINSSTTISVVCATGATRALGSVSGVSSIACSGSIANGACQQMTVSCPGVPNVQAFVKTNTPSGTILGTATYNTGTDGNGLYESIFTFGSTAVQNVLNAGFRTVQISWGTPFTSNQPNGWAEGPGGVLASACRYATVTNWIYSNIQNNNNIPMCATANSGGAGALAYALSQYPTFDVLSMAEVTSGPPTGRLDWGCGCTAGKMAVQCGSSTTLGTCFGTADAPVWDPAYNPNSASGAGVCSAAVNGTLPPGGLNFFLGDSVEAPGATYTFPKTYVNLVFGGADSSSAIPIGQDWFDNITSTKAQACVAGGLHSLANTLPGAQQIANDLIGLCKLQ